MADSATMQQPPADAVDDPKQAGDVTAAAAAAAAPYTESSTVNSASLFLDYSSAAAGQQQQQQQEHNVTASSILDDSIAATSMYLDASTAHNNTTTTMNILSPSPPKGKNNDNSIFEFNDYSTEENMALKVETNDLFLLDDGETDGVGDITRMTTPTRNNNNNNSNNISMVSSNNDGGEDVARDNSLGCPAIPPSYVAAIATGSLNVVTPDKQSSSSPQQADGAEEEEIASVQRQLVMDDYANNDASVTDAAAAAPSSQPTTTSLSAELLAALSFTGGATTSQSPATPSGLVDTTLVSSDAANNTSATSLSPTASPSAGGGASSSNSNTSSSWFGNLWSSSPAKGRGLLSLSSPGTGDEHERRMLDEEQLEERLKQHFASGGHVHNGSNEQETLRIRTDAMYLGDVVSVVESGQGGITRTNSARSIKTDDFSLDHAAAAAVAMDADEQRSNYRLVAATAAGASTGGAAAAAAASTPQKSNVSSVSPAKTQEPPLSFPNSGQDDNDDVGKISPRSSDTTNTLSSSASWWQRRDKKFCMCVAFFFLVIIIVVVLCLALLLPKDDSSASSSSSGTNTSTSSNVRDIPPVGGRGDNTAVPTIAPPPSGGGGGPLPTTNDANAKTDGPTPTVVLTVPLPEEPSTSPVDAVVGTTMVPTFAAATPGDDVPVPATADESPSTSFPTFAIDPATRLGAILSILSSVVDMGLLQDPSTPQGQAVEWLVNAPPTVYNTPVTQEDGTTITAFENTYLIERFALLVLEYSMMGSNTTSTANRRALRRNDHVKVNEGTLSGSGSSRRLVMAHADHDTCDWEGVTCHTYPSPSSETDSYVEKIDWSGRMLSGSIPKEIGILTSLYHLDLAENYLQGSLPDGLFDLVDLEYLYLQDNLLTGTLPERFADLEYLENVYLGRNRFTGPFPKGLGSPGRSASSARDMRYLSLYQNFLSGPIPDGLNLRHLYYFDLSHNRFNGSLPTEWADEAYGLTEVRLLYLDNNEFSGKIPSNWPRLGNGRVETLHMANNQLTGTLPGGYEPLNFLQSLEVQGNQLSGSIPSDVCSLLVFDPQDGELVNLRADCDICTCDVSCGPNECG